MSKVLLTGVTSLIFGLSLGLPVANAATETAEVPQSGEASEGQTQSGGSFYSNVEILNRKITEDQEKDYTVPTRVILDPVTSAPIIIGKEDNKFPREIITTEEISSLVSEITKTEEEVTKENLLASDDEKTPTVFNIIHNLIDVRENATEVTETTISEVPLVEEFPVTEEGTIISLDIPWNPGDEVGAIAAPAPEPEPEPEPDPEIVVPETASRESSYSETTYDPAPAPLGAASSIVETALQYVGYPYVYGASGPNAFDCSGFTSYIYGLHGIGLPRVSYAQGSAGTYIDPSQAQPGDIVVTNGGGHVGIYLGNGQMVHASTPATGVKVGDIWGSHYFVRF